MLTIPHLSVRAEYVDHNLNIINIIDNSNIRCDYLHGSRSSTLKSMLDTHIEDLKGCLLSRQQSSLLLGQQPRSGNILSVIARGESTTPVHNGRGISTAYANQGEIAVHYATNCRYADPESFPIILGIRHSDTMHIESKNVQAPDFSDSRAFTDCVIDKKVNAEDIRIIISPPNQVENLKKDCQNTPLDHVKILPYEYF
jgi:hypothetical protein